MSLWLALSLLVAPLAPAFAAAAPAKDAHAAATAAMHADHAEISHDTATGQQDASCTQHEQCSGSCCAACAQCYTAVSSVPASFAAVLAVYSPTVPRLHDRLTVAPHDRPPAV